MLLNKTQVFLLKYIIPVFLLVIGLCNFFIPEKTQDFDTLYDYAKKNNDAYILCKAYAIKLQENRITIDESLELMDAYDELSINEKTLFAAALKKQKLDLFSFYEKLSQSNFSTKKDKGNLVLAYNNVLKKESPLPYLEKIENHNQNYWNYISGKYFADKEEDEEALTYLEKEFELHPSNTRNNEVLASEWYYTRQNEKLESLLEKRPENISPYGFESRYYYKS